MGEDKALKRFLGRTLIERVLDRLAPIADEVMITTNRPSEYTFLGRCLVPDLIPDCGPLSGFHAAFTSALFPTIAVVACDMPFASADLLQEEAKLLVEKNVDIVVPRSTGGLEPMHAVYRRKTCLPAIKYAISQGNYCAIGWFSYVRVQEINVEAVAGIDPSENIFRNINTPDDFVNAELMAREAEGSKTPFKNF